MEIPLGRLSSHGLYLTVFPFLKSIYRSYLACYGCISMKASAGNLFITISCFLGACYNSRSGNDFGYGQFDSHQGGFVTLLWTRVLGDLKCAGQYELDRKFCFQPVFFTFAK